MITPNPLSGTGIHAVGGISAVLGAIIPLMLNGKFIEQLTKTGGGVVLTGMIVSIIGVALCGKAGFMKEWKGVGRKTYASLIIALLVLIGSFILMSYGSYIGEQDNG